MLCRLLPSCLYTKLAWSFPPAQRWNGAAEWHMALLETCDQVWERRQEEVWWGQRGGSVRTGWSHHYQTSHLVGSHSCGTGSLILSYNESCPTKFRHRDPGGCRGGRFREAKHPEGVCTHGLLRGCTARAWKENLIPSQRALFKTKSTPLGCILVHPNFWTFSTLFLKFRDSG